MKKKLSLVIASVMALSLSFYSLASATETVVIPADTGKFSNEVYLNGQPIKENTVIYANDENQEDLVEKYGLEKPSPSAKLVSIQIVNNDVDATQPKSILPKDDNDYVSPSSEIFGFKIVKGATQNVDGWTEVARAKYFCSKAIGLTCAGVQLSVTANESVSVQVQSSLTVGANKAVAAEFGRTVGESIGVSTIVNVPIDVPGGKTGIAVGYPIYKSTFCSVYGKGIFSDTFLGGATYLEPKPSSIAVTSWIQG